MTINPAGKKRKENEEQHPFLVEIQVWIEGVLKQFAAFLQAKTAGYPAHKKKAFLCFFCLAFATASGWIAYNSIQERPLSTLRVAPLHFVPLVNGDEPSHPPPLKELQRVHQFKLYLDSLSASEQGQALRDSLLRGRPHLIDTLNYLEEIFNNEQKNKVYGKEEPQN